MSPVVLPNVIMHNAGNDALMSLFALQMLLEPIGTQVPSTKKLGMRPRSGVPGPLYLAGAVMNGNGMSLPMMPAVTTGYMGVGMVPSPTTPPYDLAAEFEQMQMGMVVPQSGSGSLRGPPRVPSGNINGSFRGSRQNVWKGVARE